MGFWWKLRGMILRRRGNRRRREMRRLAFRVKMSRTLQKRSFAIPQLMGKTERTEAWRTAAQQRNNHPGKWSIALAELRDPHSEDRDSAGRGESVLS